MDIVPLTIAVGGKQYEDYYDLTPEEFLTILKSSPTLPKTSQVNPTTFLEHFRLWENEFKDIICVTLSSNGSGTYNSAEMALKEYNASSPKANIHLVDTLSCSMGVGLIAITGAKMVKEGFTAPKIAERLISLRDRLGSYLIPKDLEYLLKGGRVNTVTAVIGGLLGISPIISVLEGWGRNVGTVRGVKQFIKKLIDIFEEKRDINFKDVFIAHSGIIDKALELKAGLLGVDPDLNILIGHTGATMSTHTGPGMLGEFFFEKKNRW